MCTYTDSHTKQRSTHTDPHTPPHGYSKPQGKWQKDIFIIKTLLTAIQPCRFQHSNATLTSKRDHITQPNKNITTISREFNPLSKRQRLTLNWTLVESKPKLFGNTLHLKQWEADDDQKQHQINAPFAECRSHRDKKNKRGKERFLPIQNNDTHLLWHSTKT